MTARALIALFAALAAAGCGRSGPPPGGADCTGPPPGRLPDVVLVTFDALRADRCSAYGHPRPTTPALDRVAAEGVLFESAYAVTPTTGPSHATLFTSLYPDEHGVLSNRWELQGEAVTLAEMLRSAGYRTGGFASSYMVNADTGMAQGFDTFDDDFESGATSAVGREQVQGEEVEGDFDRRAADTADRALAWLAEQPADAPLFLWLHSYQPHTPYRPSPEAVRDVLGDEFDAIFGAGRAAEPDEAERLRARLARYDAETRWADEHVGRVLAAAAERGREAGLLSIVTSDHGEGLGDHDWHGHGVYLFEEAVRVPLVMSWPGRLPVGGRVGAAVGLIDVLPTLLALLGIECAGAGADLRGADLAPTWAPGDGAVPAAGPVFLRRRFYAHDEDKFAGKEVTVKGTMTAVRDGRWKLVVRPDEGDPQLFDLEDDPAEQRDVSGDHPEVSERLQGLERAWRQSQHLRVPRLPEELDELDREALRQLGYVE